MATAKHTSPSVDSHENRCRPICHRQFGENSKTAFRCAIHQMALRCLTLSVTAAGLLLVLCLSKRMMHFVSAQFFCLTMSLSHRTNTTIKRDKNTLRFSQRRKNLIIASATLPAWSRLRRHPSWHPPLSEKFVFSFVSFVFVLALVLLHGMTRRDFFFAATNYHSVGDFSLRPKNDKMVLEVSSSTSSPSSRRNGVPLISLTNYSSAQTKTISRRWLVCSLTHAHFNHRHMRFPDWIVIHSISSSTVFVKS